MLQAAGSSRLPIIGVGHYDPYLAEYRERSSGRELAAATLDAISDLVATH